MNAKKVLILGPIFLVLVIILLLAVMEKPQSALAAKGFAGTAGSVVSVPVNVVADIPFTVKEQVEDTLVRQTAKTALSKLQNKVLDKIKTVGVNYITGNSGSPAFVQDWRQFLQAGQYRGENIFRATIADATVGSTSTVCNYFKNSLASMFNAKTTVKGFSPTKYRVDALQYFKIENACKLPTSLNVEAFSNDFKKGGWQAFDKLLEPSNNFYSVYSNALGELAKQRAFEEQVNKSDAEAGNGFTSKRKNCQGTSSGLSCVVLGQIQTPGQILGETVQRSIEEDFSWITSADEFSELIAAVGNVLLNAVLSKIDDLASGSSSETSGFTVAQCLAECVGAGNLTCSNSTTDCNKTKNDSFYWCSQQYKNPTDLSSDEWTKCDQQSVRAYTDCLAQNQQSQTDYASCQSNVQTVCTTTCNQ